MLQTLVLMTNKSLAWLGSRQIFPAELRLWRLQALSPVSRLNPKLGSCAQPKWIGKQRGMGSTWALLPARSGLIRKGRHG